MSIETVIRGLLKNDTAVNTATGGRIHPVHPGPNSDMPFVVYKIVDSYCPQTMAGPCGLERYGVQLDVWAYKRSEAMEIMADIKDVLNGYRTAPVQNITLSGYSDDETEDGYVISKMAECWINT